MTETKRKLLRIRKSKSLSNKELGEAIGVKPDTIKKYLAEKLTPSKERMDIIDKLDAGEEIMSTAEVRKLANQVEDFVAGKIDALTFDKKFPDVLELLCKRHCQKELEL